jgi:hypothetical protein
MPGTLLVYDQGFPRASTRAGEPIHNRPTLGELERGHYPAPRALLPIPQAAGLSTCIAQMVDGARRLSRSIDVLIVFGHGQVSRVATPSGVSPVTTGILLGAEPLTQSNARALQALRPRLARGAHCELWVCQAASTGSAGTGRDARSGHRLCQAIANALAVPVHASAVDQRTTTVSGHGSLDSEVEFLPWEGELQVIRPASERRPSH